MRQKRSRQHDPKCRLNIIPHRVIQLYHSGSQRQGCASHSSTNKKIPSEASEIPSDTIIHLVFFLIHTKALRSQPVRGKVHRIGRIFPEHTERSFLDPEYIFVRSSTNTPNYIREAKVRPIKNQLYSPNTPNYVSEQMFAQLSTGLRGTYTAPDDVPGEVYVPYIYSHARLELP